MGKRRPANMLGTRIPYAVQAVCGFLIIAVVLVFGQTISHDFINYDDDTYVYENPRVAHGLTVQGIAWAFTSNYACNWHPLTWLSHMLDCQLYGLAPWGHHLTNVLLHAATTILLFLVLRRMTGDLWPSALVAAVFAIHPLHVESVAWVAERKDVLSGLFFMLTLWAYLDYVRHPFSLARYLMVMVFFALGLMAKPMLVTLPFVLLLLDYWPLGRMEQASGENRNKRSDGS
jgi:protein O-mannosyl-transferase